MMKYGIPKFLSGCQAVVYSGRQKLMCGYPPSLARSQNTGNDILGIDTKDKSGLRPLFLYMLFEFVC